jgi:hypothetical protein
LILFLALAQPSPYPNYGAENKPKEKLRIEDLLATLADGTIQAGNEAAAAILDLGPEALPLLRQARSSANLESCRRIDELIGQLQRKRLLEPKTVTLHLTNRPVGEVLRSLSDQTGFKIAPLDRGFGTAPSGKEAVYTFHFDKLPFWEAVDKVCESSGMILQQNYWGDDFLRLHAADSYVPFNSYSGPFKVMATGFNYYRANSLSDLSSGTARRSLNENLSVNLSIAVEPRLPIVRLGSVKIIEAVDALGHSMVQTEMGRPRNEPQYYYGGWYRTYVQQVQANLTWPSKKAQTIKLLRGVIPISILSDQKPIVITENLLNARGKRLAIEGASFLVEDVKDLGGRQYQIRIAISEARQGNAADWTRIDSLQQRLDLLDLKGAKYEFYFNGMKNSGNTVQATLMVQPPRPNVGPLAKLVYHSWNVMETDVPFQFQGLPLPMGLEENEQRESKNP